MLILICDAFDASLPARLAPFGEVTEDMDRLREAHVALIRSKTKATADWLAQAPNLKLIIRGGVGLDNVDVKAAQARGIAVRNTPRASSVAVAELAMAMMLAIPNRLVEAHSSMREGKWLKKELKRTELFGKTLGLLGVGLIGSEVAKRAAAFGMTIVAYDPFVSEHPVAALCSLDDLLARADYLSLHTPLTDQTRGMINAATIAKMKKGVIIINTGRGKVVVESVVAEIDPRAGERREQDRHQRCAGSSNAADVRRRVRHRHAVLRDGLCSRTCVPSAALAGRAGHRSGAHVCAHGGSAGEPASR